MDCPYHPLEVLETYSRVNGRQFWVRDDESAVWHLVEYVARRLTCWCDDAPDCAHLSAVVAHRAADQPSSVPHAVINAASFVD